MTGLLQFSVTVDGRGLRARRIDGEPAILVVSGEVDIATCPVLRRAIDSVLGTGRADVVIDVAGVEFIDAMGIGVLIRAAGEARRAGGRLVLRAPSRAVHRMLGLLQLHGSLPTEG